MGFVQLGATMTDKEIDAVVAFLKTTTGVQPKVVYPILPAPTNKTPTKAGLMNNKRNEKQKTLTEMSAFVTFSAGGGLPLIVSA